MDTIKLLEENIGRTLFDIEFGNDFLHMTQKAQTTKAKIDKRDYMKLQILYLIRDYYPEYIMSSYNSTNKKQSNCKMSKRRE